MNASRSPSAPSSPRQPVPARELFPRLPDDARLWTFGADRPLGREEEARLLAVVDGFLEGWKAHGSPLAAAREWLYGRFLIVAVDESVAAPSGCSIDALVRRLRGVEAELEVGLVGGAPVWYREGGADGPLRRVSRPDFKELARSGEVAGNTVVFDLSVTRLEALRAGRWELPARKSWHRRYLP